MYSTMNRWIESKVGKKIGGLSILDRGGSLTFVLRQL